MQAGFNCWCYAESEVVDVASIVDAAVVEEL
jgi:hypothetical protein